MSGRKLDKEWNGGADLFLRIGFFTAVKTGDIRGAGRLFDLIGQSFAFQRAKMVLVLLLAVAYFIFSHGRSPGTGLFGAQPVADSTP